MTPQPLPLPDFPWDRLTPARQRAAQHPDGVCDLSIGTPVDPTPQLIQDALVAAADSPGYPTVMGTEEVRDAIRLWGRGRRMVDPGSAGVLPTIGSKEAVAWTPLMLGIRPGDTVLVPHVAYPTYDIGARLAGGTPIPVDTTRPDTWPDAELVYLNSPGNPTGHVLSVEQLQTIVAWARQRGAIIVSDECYAALPWQEPYVSEGVPSVLDVEVCGGDASGIIVLYSLSKQSNLAGYRAALIYGDPQLVAQIVEVRKHAGMMVPGPVQHAMAVALGDGEHVSVQYRVYQQRREVLERAIVEAGLVTDPHTSAGLYLWVSAPEVQVTCWDLVERFAQLGIVVAPGDFYGSAGERHVRVALTATDERVSAAAERIRQAGSGHFAAS